jgi:hypothetical protein
LPLEASLLRFSMSVTRDLSPFGALTGPGISSPPS